MRSHFIKIDGSLFPIINSPYQKFEIIFIIELGVFFLYLLYTMYIYTTILYTFEVYKLF